MNVNQSLIHDPAMREYTMQKIQKLQYKEIRKALKSHSTRFSHLHEDSELKRMSTHQAAQLLHWFNEQAFEVNSDYMLSNYDPQFYVDA